MPYRKQCKLIGSTGSLALFFGQVNIRQHPASRQKGRDHHAAAAWAQDYRGMERAKYPSKQAQDAIKYRKEIMAPFVFPAGRKA